jgi:hypothetical protein
LVVRRLLPFVPFAAAAAFAIGAAIGGPGAGWSARISATAVSAVALGGFVVRLGVILVVLLALDGTAWFSAAAFVAAVVPTTIATLVAEMRLLADRRTQADLWYFRGGA